MWLVKNGKILVMKKRCLCWVSFLQALGLVLYCGLIGAIFWRGEKWFGRMANFWGPFLMLIILVTSALVCGLIVFGYPIRLVLKEKKMDKAVKLVLYTSGWLVGFSLMIISGIRLTRGF